jgi:N-acetylglutamate synthase-like GNAT family acetyltransferase
VVPVIRDFELSDTSDVVEILRANDQLRFPEVDGPEAMRRIRACDAATFLVYEGEDKAVGCIRGTYDGSRAMINQLSVHPLYQKKGIGSALVREIVNRFHEQGAPTVSAHVTERSLGFWEKAGFKRTEVFLVGDWIK